MSQSVSSSRSSDQGPFIKKVSSDTIAMWLKQKMANADIDTGKLTARSCRFATPSKAENIGVSLNIVITSVSWSKYTNFKGFYHTEINDSHKNNHTRFGLELLKNVK